MYGIGGTPPARGLVVWRGHQTTVDYPPVFLYEYALVGKVYGRIFPGYPDTRALLVFIKLPVLAAGMALTWMFFLIVRHASGQDAAARWAALAYWLNPATIFGGEIILPPEGGSHKLLIQQSARLDGATAEIF
jgi:Gpi18-like mannosyltransferase